MNNLKRIIGLLLVLLSAVLVVACNKEDTSDTENTAKNGVAFYVEYNDTRITMGAEADSIIEKLGEAQDRREIGDCGGLGAQVKYSYPSLEIYVLESKTEGNIIDQITFRDDLVSTPEGVYIGMSADEATEKLGESTAKTDKSMEYEKNGFVLKLGIDNGSITEIDYITVTE